MRKPVKIEITRRHPRGIALSVRIGGVRIDADVTGLARPHENAIVGLDALAKLIAPAIPTATPAQRQIVGHIVQQALQQIAHVLSHPGTAEPQRGDDDATH